MSLHSSHRPYESVFEKDYDVVIYGAGYIGFSLAMKLESMGLQVLLAEASGILLWESTAALENELAAEGAGAPALVDWLNTKGKRLKPNDCIDPVQLEVLAASELLQARERSGLATLFYMQPVSADWSGPSIESVIFAGKEGFRRIRSRHWVDASEAAVLAKACYKETLCPGRDSDISSLRMVVQSTVDEELDVFEGVASNVDGLEVCASTLAKESYLRWTVNGEAWHVSVERVLEQVREHLAKDVDAAVSHSSMCPYPIYTRTDSTPVVSGSAASNFKVLSPTYLSQELKTLSERFQLGADYAETCAQELNRGLSLRTVSSAVSEIVPDQVETFDVVVAGAGTAGAIAGLAAGQAGARTCVFDQSQFPGGVGTVSGITCYFFGLPGGLQETINDRTDELSKQLFGRKVASTVWHQDAKKIALLEAFEAASIHFQPEAIICDLRMSDSGVVSSVRVAQAGQLIEYRAKSFIDSTGDADLCAFAGAETKTGREGDQRCLAYSQAALTVKRTDTSVVIRNQNFDAGWLNAVEAEDLTRARLCGIAQYASVDWDRDLSLRAIAPSLGIRQSRTVITDYMLRFSDLMGRTQFADAFGSASAHADTHSVDFEFEDDDAAFFYWVCRLFRLQLRTELPYRMLLPRGLRNVWVACRAAGMETNVFYAIRMQRDMQRLGEAAGRAAAIAARSSEMGESRSVEVGDLIMPVERSKSELDPAALSVELILSEGNGEALWALSAEPEKYRSEVVDALEHGDTECSFRAACLLAMWEDVQAESRLLEAIATRETGSVNYKKNRGAYGQEIDIPHWLQAVILLRRCGSEDCVSALLELASEKCSVFNVKTALALTTERLLLKRRISEASALSILKHLESGMDVDVPMPSSYSIVRYLRKEPQMILPNDIGADASESHMWQLDLVIARMRQHLSLDPLPRHCLYLKESRGFVRCQFEQVLNDQEKSSPFSDDLPEGIEEELEPLGKHVR